MTKFVGFSLFLFVVPASFCAEHGPMSSFFSKRNEQGLKLPDFSPVLKGNPTRSLRNLRKEMKDIFERHAVNDSSCQQVGIKVGNPKRLSERKSIEQDVHRESYLFMGETMLRALCSQRPKGNGAGPSHPDRYEGLSILRRSRVAQRPSWQKLSPEKQALRDGEVTDVSQHYDFNSMDIGLVDEGEKNIALLHSLQMALIQQESSWNPLGDAHVSKFSSLRAPKDRETGLTQISAALISQEAVPPVKEQMLLEAFLKMNEIFEEEDESAGIIGSLVSRAKANGRLNRMCGWSFFEEFPGDLLNEDKRYFQDSPNQRLRLEYMKESSSFDHEERVKVVKGKGRFSKLAHKSLRRDLANCQDEIEDLHDNQDSNTFLYSLSDSARKGTRLKDHPKMIQCVRSVLMYCPRLNVEISNVMLRRNFTHNGPVERKDVAPSCKGYFSDLAQRFLRSPEKKNMCELLNE